jgi:ATP-dependent DNA helicase HFM1/MER3
MLVPVGEGRTGADDGGGRREQVGLYQNLTTAKRNIESKLHTNIIEHLNAEARRTHVTGERGLTRRAQIALGTVTDISVAILWLKSTFLYIRLRQNPQHYNLPAHMTEDRLDEQLKSAFPGARPLR